MEYLAIYQSSYSYMDIIEVIKKSYDHREEGWDIEEYGKSIMLSNMNKEFAHFESWIESGGFIKRVFYTDKELIGCLFKGEIKSRSN